VPGTWKASQPPGASQRVDQPGEQGQVVGDPLQHRVADQHVHRLGGHPVAQVGDREVDARDVPSGLLDHVRAGVQAADPGRRPPLGEQRGHVPRAAAQVDHGARLLGLDAADQVDERPGAFAGEGQVPLRIPLHRLGHGVLLFG
jgi:hypothetical protein